MPCAFERALQTQVRHHRRDHFLQPPARMQPQAPPSASPRRRRRSCRSARRTARGRRRHRTRLPDRLRSRSTRSRRPSRCSEPQFRLIFRPSGAQPMHSTLRPQPLKQRGSQIASPRRWPHPPTMRHAIEAARQRRRQMFDIFAIQALVDRQSVIWGPPRPFEREDVALQHVLLLIRQLESGMIDDLDAVVADTDCATPKSSRPPRTARCASRAQCREW